MKNIGLVLLFLILLILLPMACIRNTSQVPTSPEPRSIYTPIYTITNTPTITPSPTITSTPSSFTPTWTLISSPIPTATITPTPIATNTPNPSCPANADITSYIDGQDYPGDDFGHALGTLNLDHGGSTMGDVLTFTLATAKTLNFSLCPTEDLTRPLFLYIRPNCTSAAGESWGVSFCAGLAQVTGVSLAAGSYYAIVTEGSAPATTAYALRIKSGSIASLVYTVTPQVTPVAVSPGTATDCSIAYALNGGTAFSGQRIATGQLDDTTNTDDFYTFKPAITGPVTVTLDGFDNGMNDTDFDIVGASSCPAPAPTPVPPTIVGESLSTNPVEQFIFPGTAGTSYWIDVEAFLGLGPYRLTVQTP